MCANLAPPTRSGVIPERWPKPRPSLLGIIGELMTISLIDGRADTASAARIVSGVLRWFSVEPEALEQIHATRPSYRGWLGMLDGQPVGYASCSPPLSSGNETRTASASLFVLRSARHQGVGGALYRRISRHAVELGRAELEMIAYADDPDSEGFAAKHGFRIVYRAPSLRLTLAHCPRPDVQLPEGLTLSSLAQCPELDVGVWETAREAFPDIPYDGDTAMQVGTYEEFTARFLAGPRFIPEATFVALAAEEVVGYGQLCWMNRAAGVGDHEMLAVRPGWRRRGIAQALKAAQIAWAIDHGLSELRTNNEERNTPVRAVNAHFPYARLPDKLLYRGPCAGTRLKGHS
jgi:GNAT superfamily N-acetyltransferase